MRETQGRWVGSGIVMAGLIALFAAAGGIGAPGCGGGVSSDAEGAAPGSGEQGSGNSDQGPASNNRDRVSIVDVDLPTCVDTGLAGVIHLDREFKGELEVELLYRSKEDQQLGFGGVEQAPVDTGRSATVRFDGSAEASFDFGQFRPDHDAHCFELDGDRGAERGDWSSWKRGKGRGTCIPVCDVTTTTSTTSAQTTSSQTTTVPTTTSTTTGTTTTAPSTTTTTTTVPKTTTTSMSTTTVPTTTTSTTSTTTVPTTTTISTTTVPATTTTTVPTTTNTLSTTTTTTTTAPTTTTSTTTVPTTTTTSTTTATTTTSSTTSTTTYSHVGYCLVDPGSGEMTGQCQSWDPYTPACFVGDAPSVCSGNTNDAFGQSPCGDGNYITRVICRF